jgi:hypothetical protein
MKCCEFIALLGGRGRMAARGACPAAGDAGGWFSPQASAKFVAPAARKKFGARTTEVH